MGVKALNGVLSLDSNKSHARREREECSKVLNLQHLDFLIKSILNYVFNFKENMCPVYCLK